MSNEQAWDVIKQITKMVRLTHDEWHALNAAIGVIEDDLFPKDKPAQPSKEGDEPTKPKED